MKTNPVLNKRFIFLFIFALFSTTQQTISEELTTIIARIPGPPNLYSKATSYIAKITVDNNSILSIEPINYKTFKQIKDRSKILLNPDGKIKTVYPSDYKYLLKKDFLDYQS